MGKEKSGPSYPKVRKVPYNDLNDSYIGGVLWVSSDFPYSASRLNQRTSHILPDPRFLLRSIQ
jgi:hypothetical protein